MQTLFFDSQTRLLLIAVPQRCNRQSNPKQIPLHNNHAFDVFCTIVGMERWPENRCPAYRAIHGSVSKDDRRTSIHTLLSALKPMGKKRNDQSVSQLFVLTPCGVGKRLVFGFYQMKPGTTLSSFRCLRMTTTRAWTLALNRSRASQTCLLVFRRLNHTNCKLSIVSMYYTIYFFGASSSYCCGVYVF